MIEGPLGGQTVTVIRKVPKLDTNGQPVISEIGVPQTVEDAVDQPGCMFELQDLSVGSVGAAEVDTDTVTTHSVAWCLMPVTDVSRAIDSTMALRYGGKVYQMRGDGRVEYDLDGVADHVFCLAEGQAG